MWLLGRLFRSRAAYELAGRLGRWLGRHAPRALLGGRWNAWARQRELPALPAQSFRELWRRERAGRRAG
jgi:L-lactate dehydrogenase complex protein LldF